MSVTPLPAVPPARVPTPALCAVLALLVLLGLTTALDGAPRQWTANVGVLVLAVGAVLGCLRAARRSRDSSRRGWVALAVAAGSWAGGQLVYTVYETGLGLRVPFPSPADAGYLGFPVAALVGLVLLSPRMHGMSTPRRVLDALMIGVAFGLLAWFIVVDPLSAGLPAVDAAVSLAYPIADVVLLTVALLTLAQTREKPLLWGLLCAAMLAMAVSDVAFSFATSAGTYVSGSPVDWGWWAAFCLLGTAGSLVTGRRRNAARPIAPETVASASVLPYLPLTGAVLAAAVESTAGGGLDPVAVGLLTVLVVLVLVRQYATVLDNQRLLRAVRAREGELHRLAFHDGLTGLANRALFLDRLGHALDLADRDRHDVSVVFLDLDGFKAVNDSLGHAMGDALLVHVAERLHGALHTSDTLARLGGDEFAVLVEQAGHGGASAVAQRLLSALRPPFRIDGRTVAVSASIGVATTEAGPLGRATGGPAEPEPTGAANLLHRADLAMYAVKASGKGHVGVHSLDLDGALHRDGPAMVRAFTAALERGDVRAIYQPVVDPVSGRIGALEALARWTHEGVPISPAVFVPMTAEAGLSEHLTALMLEQACAQLGTWSRALGHSRLRVAVNLDPTELSDVGLPDRIANLLARHGLDAGQLALEMTESALTNRPETTVDVMNRLREVGVRLAIDDFGTGYSTLARLAAMPVDTVKIDRFFVADIDHDVRQKRFLVGLLELTRHLGLRTIAEGVERPGQLRELNRLGCDLVQGHLIAHPATAEALTPVVLDERPILSPELLGRTRA